MCFVSGENIDEWQLAMERQINLFQLISDIVHNKSGSKYLTVMDLGMLFITTIVIIGMLTIHVMRWHGNDSETNYRFKVAHIELHR